MQLARKQASYITIFSYIICWCASYSAEHQNTQTLWEGAWDMFVLL